MKASCILRTVLPLILTSTLLAAPVYGAQVAWVHSLDEAMAVASQERKFIVLDVHTAWSPGSRILTETVYTDSRFIEFAKSQVFMSVDAERDVVGERMRRRFDVRVFPTILVLDSQGKEIERLRGAPTAPELISLLQVVFDTPIPPRELDERAKANPNDPKLQAAAGRRAAARGDFKSAQPFLAREEEPCSYYMLLSGYGLVVC